MEYSISNSALTVRVSTFGAELVSVKNHLGTEFLWQAEPNVWKRHAPILFPYIGRLQDDELRLENEVIKGFSQHGFARDLEFDLVSRDENYICLILDSAKVSTSFPFEFEFKVTYTLEGNAINTEFEVTNKGPKLMPFTLGYHPAFRCPLNIDDELRDYHLGFDLPEYSSRLLLVDGLIDNEEKYLTGELNLPLSKELFSRDAIILHDLSSDQISLVHKHYGSIVTMHNLHTWNYLGIWSKTEENARFVCIEPWMSTADHAGQLLDFKDKKGVVILYPDKYWTNLIRMEFNEHVRIIE